MNGPVLLLCLLSFAALGSLPFVFFRPGRKTTAWWLTASPFLLDAVLVVLALGGVIAPWRAPGLLAYLAVPFIAAALGLLGATLGSHARPLALWHQDDDAPESIVRHGAYRHIRHPFYVSFILMLAGTALALPHAGTLTLLVVGAWQLNRTAAREERRLLATSFGAEYAAYMEVAGRFAPRLRGASRREHRRDADQAPVRAPDGRLSPAAPGRGS